LRLRSTILFRIARVQTVGLHRELLIPQWSSASDTIVRLVTIHAEIRTRSSDGRPAAGAKVVHADHVACELSEQGPCCQSRHQAHVGESGPHYIPSLGFFKPK